MHGHAWTNNFIDNLHLIFSYFFTFTFSFFLFLPAPFCKTISSTLISQEIKLSLSSPLSTEFIVSPCVVMYCLPSFFSCNGFYGFYGGILHGRAPIVSTARDKSLQCHLIFSSPPHKSFSSINFSLELECVARATPGNLASCFLWAMAWESRWCVCTLVWQAGNCRERWKVAVKAAWKSPILKPHYPMKPVSSRNWGGICCQRWNSTQTTWWNFCPLTPWGISSQ